jgi:hypothetical protein
MQIGNGSPTTNNNTSFVHDEFPISPLTLGFLGLVSKSLTLFDVSRVVKSAILIYAILEWSSKY